MCAFWAAIVEQFCLLICREKRAVSVCGTSVPRGSGMHRLPIRKSIIGCDVSSLTRWSLCGTQVSPADRRSIRSIWWTGYMFASTHQNQGFSSRSAKPYERRCLLTLISCSASARNLGGRHAARGFKPPSDEITNMRLSENRHVIARSRPACDLRCPMLPFQECIFLL
jgi:hypothetical protein